MVVILLFGLRRKKVDKGKWAEILYRKKIPNPEAQSEAQFTKLTTIMLEQHYRIISESVQILHNTKNEDTRQGRISLCRNHYQYMLELEPFCNDEQKVLLQKAKKVLKGII